MKLKTILALFLLFLPVTIFAKDSYKIYEPGRPVLYKYRVEKRSDGTLAIFSRDQYVLPKFIIKPDPTSKGDYKVFKVSDPVIPIYRTKGR